MYVCVGKNNNKNTPFAVIDEFDYYYNCMCFSPSVVEMGFKGKSLENLLYFYNLLQLRSMQWLIN